MPNEALRWQAIFSSSRSLVVGVTVTAMFSAFASLVRCPAVIAVNQFVVLIDFDRRQHFNVGGVALNRGAVRFDARIEVFAPNNIKYLVRLS